LSEQQRQVYEELKVASFVSRIGAPSLAGALVGASAGAIPEMMYGRQEGEDWGDYLRRGARSAGKGALIGGALGAGAGAVSPEMAERTVNYGKGVLHTYTGWTPKGGLSSIGAGAAPLKKMRERSLAAGATPQQLANLDARIKATQGMEDRGLTSLPGLVKGLLPGRFTDTLKATKDHLLDGTSGFDKAMLAAGVATSLTPLLDKDRPVSDRVMDTGRGLFFSTAMAPLNIATGQAATNTSAIGGMMEGLAHNIGTAPVAQIASAPINLAQAAVQRARAGKSPVDPSLLDDAQAAHVDPPRKQLLGRAFPST
jgi:hypothetical protein